MFAIKLASTLLSTSYCIPLLLYHYPSPPISYYIIYHYLFPPLPISYYTPLLYMYHYLSPPLPISYYIIPLLYTTTHLHHYLSPIIYHCYISLPSPPLPISYYIPLLYYVTTYLHHYLYPITYHWPPFQLLLCPRNVRSPSPGVILIGGHHLDINTYIFKQNIYLSKRSSGCMQKLDRDLRACAHTNILDLQAYRTEISMHVHTQTYIFIDIHTERAMCMRTQKHTSSEIRAVHMHTQTYIFTDSQTNIHLHRYTEVSVHMHTQTYILHRYNTESSVHMHTQTYIFTDIHTQRELIRNVPTCLRMIWANSRMVCSSGLPRLTGSVKLEFIRAIRPLTRSLAATTNNNSNSNNKQQQQQQQQQQTTTTHQQ